MNVWTIPVGRGISRVVTIRMVGTVDEVQGEIDGLFEQYPYEQFETYVSSDITEINGVRRITVIRNEVAFL
jgi:hypothetical protein